jgi:uncharacterized protein
MALPAATQGSAALVTGASSGIGTELARQLADRGHDVILVARRRDRLELIASELRERGRRAEILVCDLADAAARDRLADEVETLGMQVEILVLSAGFGLGGPFLAQDPAALVQMARTNLESAFALCRALLPAMVTRRRGAVLLVSSIAGSAPMPNFSAYAATKAGITSFAQALSAEVAGSGITVTALCPGAVTTEFSQVAGMNHNHASMPKALVIGPEEAARESIRALEQGQRIVTPRRAVRAFSYFSAHVPRRLWLSLSRRLLA